jgi:DegV family protein with EDD domain
MAVDIITDSIACIPQEIANKYGITIVPLDIIYKEKVYKDGVDISPSEFYEILKTSGSLPSTSAPPPKEYLDVYEKALDKGNEILVICPSKKLTHVFGSATVAATMLKEKRPDARIEVIDSGTAAGAEGYVVMDLAKANHEKEPGLAELSKMALSIMEKVYVIVCIDTIDYLAKSGRVPYILAWTTSMLKIKPVIELLPLGKGVIPLDRPRTRQRALQRVMEILEEKTRGLAVRVMVQHANAMEDARELAQQVKSRLHCDPVYIQDFTPVMGVHTGPGLVGVSYSLYQPPD